MSNTTRSQGQEKQATFRIRLPWAMLVLVSLLLVGLGITQKPLILHVARIDWMNADLSKEAKAKAVAETEVLKVQYPIPILYSPKSFTGRQPLGIIADEPPKTFNISVDDSATLMWMSDYRHVLVAEAKKPLVIRPYHSKTHSFIPSQDVADALANPGVKYKLYIDPYDSFAPSPDDTKLVYGDKEGMKILNFKTGEKRLVISNDQFPEEDDDTLEFFAWSPDGKQIAFSAQSKDIFGLQARPHYEDLYVINEDGGGLRRLGHGFSASWSPDGHSIVASDGPKDGGKRVVRYNVQSGNVVILRTTKLAGFHFVSYSPDGKRLAIIGYPEAESKVSPSLFLTDTEGKLERVLVPWKRLKAVNGALRADW